jgi:hypothetical protein
MYSTGRSNCHHPWWYADYGRPTQDQKPTRLSPNATQIVEWLEDHDFQLVNVPGVTTHSPSNGNKPSIIDFTCVPGTVAECVSNWCVTNSNTSDHRVITFDVWMANSSIAEPNTPTIHNCWKRANWDTFQTSIKDNLIDFSDVNDASMLSNKIDDLYQLISKSISKAVPTRTLKTRYAPWWSPNLGLLSRRLRGAKKRLAIDTTQVNLETWNHANKAWLKAVRNAKNRYWDRIVSIANVNNIWDIHKNHSRTHTRSIPELENASNFKDEVDAFQRQFFTEHIANNDDSFPNSLSSLEDLSMSYERVNPTEVTTAFQKTNL